LEINSAGQLPILGLDGLGSKFCILDVRVLLNLSIKLNVFLLFQKSTEDRIAELEQLHSEAMASKEQELSALIKQAVVCPDFRFCVTFRSVHWNISLDV